MVMDQIQLIELKQRHISQLIWFVYTQPIPIHILCVFNRTKNICSIFEYKKIQIYKQTFSFLKLQIRRFTKKKAVILIGDALEYQAAAEFFGISEFRNFICANCAI